MPKPTAVATTEVAAQGAVIEVSYDSGTAWDAIPGVQSIPKFGEEVGFFRVNGIDELTERYKSGLKKLPAFELAFMRIGNNAVQDALVAAADANGGTLVDIRATYTSGDIWTAQVHLGASYMEAAEQGDNAQMIGIMGQQTSSVTKTKVV